MSRRQPMLQGCWRPVSGHETALVLPLLLLLLAWPCTVTVSAQDGTGVSPVGLPSATAAPPPQSASTCSVVLIASGLPSARTDTQCDAFTNVLDTLLGHDGYNGAFCAFHSQQAAVMLANMDSPSAQTLIQSFDPKTQNTTVIGQMLQDLSAGCPSWIKVHLSGCSGAAPDPGVGDPMATGWKAVQTTNDTVQLDFLNTPSLDCPLTCTIQAALSNISDAGLTANATCNSYASQVTQALSLPDGTAMQCRMGWGSEGGLLTQVELTADQTISLMSNISSSSGSNSSSQLIHVADMFNYDCLQPVLIIRALPHSDSNSNPNMTTKTCGPIQFVTVLGTACTNSCTAPLPHPFKYVQGSTDQPGTSEDSRFDIQCMGSNATSYRQLAALSLTVLSFGDEFIDVNGTLNTRSSTCCQGNSNQPSSTAQSKSAGRRLRQQVPSPATVNDAVQCTSPVTWNLAAGFQLSADNIVEFFGDTKNARLESNNNQVPIQNLTKATAIRDISGSGNFSLGAGQITLVSDGSQCGSGAAVYAPTGTLSSNNLKDRVRLQWASTLSVASTAPVPPTTNTASASHVAVIVGAVLGSLCGVVLLAIGAVFYWRRRSASSGNGPTSHWKLKQLDCTEAHMDTSMLGTTPRSTHALTSMLTPNSKVVPSGLHPEEPFMSYAQHFKWTGYKPGASTMRIEAGINDTQLDRLAQDGTCPVVELTRADVSQKLEVLTSGLIGKGGAALVFICRWPRRFGPDALLAMKVLRKQYDASPYLLQMFASEAKLLAALRHPNVLTLYGYCLELPTVCLIMELMPGSLEDLLYKSPKSPGHTFSTAMSVTSVTGTNITTTTQQSDVQITTTNVVQQLNMLQALQICADIASGLSYLHNRQVDGAVPPSPAGTDALLSMGSGSMRYAEGPASPASQVYSEAGYSAKIAHRDLKPANVLISSQGRAKLSDFGLAREHESSTVHTMHMGAGTLAYMAPELLDGRAGPVMLRPTNRVDIYSFGVLMWELLAGQKPWQGLSAVQLIGKVGTGKRPTIPVPVEPLTDSQQAVVELNNAPASFHVVPELVGLIKECWQQRDLRRPAANDVHDRLLTLLQKHAISTAGHNQVCSEAV